MGTKSSKHSASQEDALQILSRFDTVLIVDDSLSMAGSRWKEAGKALASLAAVASQYDTDGIEIQFLNSPAVATKVNDPAQVKRLFASVKPDGLTPIGKKLQGLLNKYLSQLEKDETIKPVNYVIITDGAATDGNDSLTDDVIVNAARELDRRNSPMTQVGIQFVQIGRDRNATKYLEDLDNSLKAKHDIRDIVDTTLPERGEELDMVKILTGGINRRVDNLGSEVVA